ncbi:hypothetical protein BD779DRAFT_136831 [Infundibulicybe gibba]|nr:hypothetical protein BD779DRAFT_136831 [Infundibulicybe gibba]
MAKGGKKGPKRYELPDEKFIVVVNPWGSPTNKLFINNVGAWFEHMLYEDYPNTQVEAIYTQGTHSNIVVELPAHVDISQYLGAHAYARFLAPPWNTSPHIAYMYEYNYESFDHPTRKGWKSSYPTYTSIPPNFPVKKEGYPIPDPAPPPTRDVVYAKKPPPLPQASVSGMNAATDTQYANKGLDDDAARLLQSLISTDIKPDIKPDIKLSLGVKEESQDDEYKPSAELIAAVSTKLDPYNDEYKPSPELISALSNTTKQEPAYEPSPELIAAISAKQEFRDDEYKPSTELIAALQTKVEPRNDAGTPGSPLRVRSGSSVKREWEGGREDEGARADVKKRQKREE